MLSRFMSARKMHRPSATALALGLTLTLGACGGGAANDAEEVLVYKPTNSLQCGPNATTPENLNAAVAALQAAGIGVKSASCGNTGNPAPAVCGIWNGDVWLISVLATSLEVVRAQGFAAASNLPQLMTTPCRASGP